MHPDLGEGQPKSTAAAAQKAALRVQLTAARRQRDHDPEAAAARTARALVACSGARVVAAYAAREFEPATAELIDALWRDGVLVLLPVLTTTPSWAWYTGAEALRPGPRGILQPSGPALAEAALARADWIWLPGLAGTVRGDRLGTGGGWYDRALNHARADAVRGLLLFDDEVLEEVPLEPWDQPVDVLVTERRRIDTIRE